MNLRRNHQNDSDKNWEVAHTGQKGQCFEIFTGPSGTLLALGAPKMQSFARGPAGIPLPTSRNLLNLLKRFIQLSTVTITCWHSEGRLNQALWYMGVGVLQKSNVKFHQILCLPAGPSSENHYWPSKVVLASGRWASAKFHHCDTT